MGVLALPRQLLYHGHLIERVNYHDRGRLARFGLGPVSFVESIIDPEVTTSAYKEGW